MSNEIMFPIKETPSFEHLLDIMVEGFNELSLSTKQTTVGLSLKKGLDLSDKFILIQNLHYFCWVSFTYFEPEARYPYDMDFPIMAGVQTRGIDELKFSVIMAYILAKTLKGRIIYDDAHLVQKKDEYPVEELRPLVDQYIKELDLNFD